MITDKRVYYKDFVEFEREEVALWIDKAENFIHMLIEGVANKNYGRLIQTSA